MIGINNIHKIVESANIEKNKKVEAITDINSDTLFDIYVIEGKEVVKYTYEADKSWCHVYHRWYKPNSAYAYCMVSMTTKIKNKPTFKTKDEAHSYQKAGEEGLRILAEKYAREVEGRRVNKIKASIAAAKAVDDARTKKIADEKAARIAQEAKIVADQLIEDERVHAIKVLALKDRIKKAALDKLLRDMSPNELLDLAENDDRISKLLLS